MAKTKQKQLSIAQLKPEVDVYKESIDVPVTLPNSEDEINVKLFPLFSPTSVAKLVNEYLLFLAQCKQENVEVLEEDEGDILGYFIVKYFTDIKTTKSKKAKMIIEEVDLLKNSQLYKELMKLFPVASVQSVHERIMEVNEAFANLEGQMRVIQKQMNELDLENRAEIVTAFNKGENNEIIQ